MSSKRKAAQILRTAAKKIETHGWIRGRLGNEGVGFCAVGAIYHSSPGRNLSGEDDNWDLAHTALELMLNGDVVRFNDRIAASAESVTSAMRRTARALEHGMVVQ